MFVGSSPGMKALSSFKSNDAMSGLGDSIAAKVTDKMADLADRIRQEVKDKISEIKADAGAGGHQVDVARGMQSSDKLDAPQFNVTASAGNAFAQINLPATISGELTLGEVARSSGTTPQHVMNALRSGAMSVIGGTASGEA